MKNFLLTLVAISALTFSANAQLKGKALLGGEVSFAGSSVKDSDSKFTGVSIVPLVGYFVTDNIAIGTGIGYASYKTEVTKDVDNSGSAFVIQPFGRMYSKHEGILKFFGQVAVPMSFGTEKENGDKIGTTNTFGVEVAPGFALIPAKNVTIDFKVRGLYFENSTEKAEGTDVKTTTTGYGLNVNSLAPSVGVIFVF